MRNADRTQSNGITRYETLELTSGELEDEAAGARRRNRRPPAGPPPRGPGTRPSGRPPAPGQRLRGAGGKRRRPPPITVHCPPAPACTCPQHGTPADSAEPPVDDAVTAPPAAPPPDEAATELEALELFPLGAWTDREVEQDLSLSSLLSYVPWPRATPTPPAAPAWQPAPPTPAPSVPAAAPSGRAWVNAFPTSRSVDSLAPPFRDKAARFIAALKAAGASVTINATRRPAERAYLMRKAWDIVKNGVSPASIAPHPGIPIRWVHTDANRNVNLAASRAGADEMVRAYSLAYQPSLTSRHIEGKAMDVDISWPGDLKIRDGNGRMVTITSTPRTGADNKELHALGATYGVFKLASDRPHWSSDGH